jgi:hypothetical protein
MTEHFSDWPHCYMFTVSVSAAASEPIDRAVQLQESDGSRWRVTVFKPVEYCRRSCATN